MDPIRPAVPSAEFVLNVAAGCRVPCTFCNRSPDRVGARIDEVLSPDFAIPAAQRVVVVSGDLIRADLVPLARRLRERGAVQVVFYAHPGPSDLGALDLLAGAGLTGILLLVPAADAPTVKRLTRGVGTLRRMVEVIDAARRLGLAIELDVPILEDTYESAPDTVRRALNRAGRAAALHLTFSAGAERGLPAPWDYRRAVPQIEEILAIARAAGVPVRLGNPAPPPCILSIRGADASLYPMLSGVARQDRPPFAACADCVLASDCSPEQLHFARDPALPPIQPLRPEPQGAPPVQGPTSASLYLRRRDLAGLMDRLAAGQSPICLSPWAVLAAHDASGGVAPCRGSMLLKEVHAACGDWTRQPLVEVWNSPGMRAVRRAVGADRPGDTCRDQCPVFFGGANLYEPSSTLPVGRRCLDNTILQLRETLDRAEVLASLPSHLVVAPSLRCNNRCRMCDVHDSGAGWADMPSVLFDSIVDLLPVLRDLSFAGAEPLMATRLPALLRECDGTRYPDLVLTLTTNGLLFSEALFRDMARTRFNTIIVSINAATAATYERVAGTSGGFDRVTGNVAALIAASAGWLARPQVALSFVAIRSNYLEMGAFVDLAHSVGATFRLLPVERDLNHESVFTDEGVLRDVVETAERDLLPRVAGRPAQERAEVDLFVARLRQRLQRGRFEPL